MRHPEGTRGGKHMKKLMTIIGLVLVICLLASFSCAKPPPPAPYPAGEPPPAPAPAPQVIPSPTPTPTPAPAPRPAPVPPPSEAETLVGEPWAERMIVRTAAISLVVNNVATTLDRVADLAESLGGYVVSSKRWKEDERLVGIITIRVPAEDFGDAMGSLHSMAVDITHEDTSAKDVTEEYVDLSAKLKNLEATEEQYLRLMEKAERVEDILDIQRELSKTRGEIEQTKGRMQYLERTSATSLIQVQLNQAKLDVKFNANKTRIKEGEKVEIEGRVHGGFPPYSYEWDFGDGETSTSAYPVHNYKNVGSYTVSLKVTDDKGNTDTKTRDEYILVRPGWSAGSIASGAWSGLVTFGHVLANIFIWLGIFSPVWIVIGGLLYWWRRRKRRA
ncbi:hypothetical protein ES707_04043 [subsurface metagenome]